MTAKKKHRGPLSVDEMIERAVAAAHPEIAEKWAATGCVVLDAISAKVAAGEAVPNSWLGFARTFSEWHADYLTVTEGSAPPKPPPSMPPKGAA